MMHRRAMDWLNWYVPGRHTAHALVLPSDWCMSHSYGDPPHVIHKIEEWCTEHLPDRWTTFYTGERMRHSFTMFGVHTRDVCANPMIGFYSEADRVLFELAWSEEHRELMRKQRQIINQMTDVIVAIYKTAPAHTTEE